MEFTCYVRMHAFLEMLQQHRLLVSGPHDQDRLAVLQRLVDPRKEGRIVGDLAGADGIGLVMQMLGCQIGKDRPLIFDIQP